MSSAVREKKSRMKLPSFLTLTRRESKNAASPANRSRDDGPTSPSSRVSSMANDGDIIFARRTTCADSKASSPTNTANSFASPSGPTAGTLATTPATVTKDNGISPARTTACDSDMNNEQRRPDKPERRKRPAPTVDDDRPRSMLLQSRDQLAVSSWQSDDAINCDKMASPATASCSSRGEAHDAVTRSNTTSAAAAGVVPPPRRVKRQAPRPPVGVQPLGASPTQRETSGQESLSPASHDSLSSDVTTPPRPCRFEAPPPPTTPPPVKSDFCAQVFLTNRDSLSSDCCNVDESSSFSSDVISVTCSPARDVTRNTDDRTGQSADDNIIDKLPAADDDVIEHIHIPLPSDLVTSSSLDRRGESVETGFTVVTSSVDGSSVESQGASHDDAAVDSSIASKARDPIAKADKIQDGGESLAETDSGLVVTDSKTTASEARNSEPSTIVSTTRSRTPGSTVIYIGSPSTNYSVTNNRLTIAENGSSDEEDDMQIVFPPPKRQNDRIFSETDEDEDGVADDATNQHEVNKNHCEMETVKQTSRDVNFNPSAVTSLEEIRPINNLRQVTVTAVSVSHPANVSHSNSATVAVGCGADIGGDDDADDDGGNFHVDIPLPKFLKDRREEERQADESKDTEHRTVEDGIQLFEVSTLNFSPPQSDAAHSDLQINARNKTEHADDVNDDDDVIKFPLPKRLATSEGNQPIADNSSRLQYINDSQLHASPVGVTSHRHGNNPDDSFYDVIQHQVDSFLDAFVPDKQTYVESSDDEVSRDYASSDDVITSGEERDDDVSIETDVTADGFYFDMSTAAVSYESNICDDAMTPAVAIDDMTPRVLLPTEADNVTDELNVASLIDAVDCNAMTSTVDDADDVSDDVTTVEHGRYDTASQTNDELSTVATSVPFEEVGDELPVDSESECDDDTPPTAFDRLSISSQPDIVAVTEPSANDDVIEADARESVSHNDVTNMSVTSLERENIETAVVDKKPSTAAVMGADVKQTNRRTSDDCVNDIAANISSLNVCDTSTDQPVANVEWSQTPNYVIRTAPAVADVIMKELMTSQNSASAAPVKNLPVGSSSPKTQTVERDVTTPVSRDSSSASTDVAMCGQRGRQGKRGGLQFVRQPKQVVIVRAGSCEVHESSGIGGATAARAAVAAAAAQPAKAEANGVRRNDVPRRYAVLGQSRAASEDGGSGGGSADLDANPAAEGDDAEKFSARLVELKANLKANRARPNSVSTRFGAGSTEPIHRMNHAASLN